MRASGPPHARIGWLTQRADYLALQGGRRWVTPFFVIQIRPQPEPTAFICRVGLTASRKVGGAVVRNRARRRLRDLARKELANLIQPGFDIVIIARTPATLAPFPVLVQAFSAAIKKLAPLKLQKTEPQINQSDPT